MEKGTRWFISRFRNPIKIEKKVILQEPKKLEILEEFILEDGRGKKNGYSFYRVKESDINLIAIGTVQDEKYEKQEGSHEKTSLQRFFHNPLFERSLLKIISEYETTYKYAIFSEKKIVTFETISKVKKVFYHAYIFAFTDEEFICIVDGEKVYSYPISFIYTKPRLQKR